MNAQKTKRNMFVTNEQRGNFRRALETAKKKGQLRIPG